MPARIFSSVHHLAVLHGAALTPCFGQACPRTRSPPGDSLTYLLSPPHHPPTCDFMWSHSIWQHCGPPACPPPRPPAHLSVYGGASLPVVGQAKPDSLAELPAALLSGVVFITACGAAWSTGEAVRGPYPWLLLHGDEDYCCMGDEGTPSSTHHQSAKLPVVLRALHACPLCPARMPPVP